MKCGECCTWFEDDDCVHFDCNVYQNDEAGDDFTCPTEDVIDDYTLMEDLYFCSRINALIERNRMQNVAWGNENANFIKKI